ncbi:hypothetical protein SSX86_008995 [Deinandra increscens subsp. villosa]|uniref:Dirigent protein n=1 Tax=Deinandra increscens subsp. villosa TaxID=3103831 RepID=A0AAP0DDQ7_9ASTR
MATLSSLLTLSLLTTISLPSPATGTFWKPPKTRPFKLGSPKLTQFQFYSHDIQTGPNPTSITITKPQPTKTNNGSVATGFGIVNMFDDPLTYKPENGSRVLGRAQGFYGAVSEEENVLLVTVSLVFMGGRYGGSTLMVVGRNPVGEKVREMPVIGGTGAFRFARGYVQATSHAGNVKTRDVIVRFGIPGPMEKSQS